MPGHAKSNQTRKRKQMPIVITAHNNAVPSKPNRTLKERGTCFCMLCRPCSPARRLQQAVPCMHAYFYQSKNEML